MGSGYRGIESRPSYIGYQVEEQELDRLTIDELYAYLVLSQASCRGGDAMQAVIEREVEKSQRISNVLRSKIIAQICRYTKMDAEVYRNKSIYQLLEELNTQYTKHIAVF